MTDTVALLAVPRVAWDFIAEAMEASGYNNHFVTMDERGQTTVALDLNGIALTPAGDASDQCINSGNLSDLLAAVGEEAFRAGHAAGKQGTFVDSAWDRYEPSDAIMELQEQL